MGKERNEIKELQRKIAELEFELSRLKNAETPGHEANGFLPLALGPHDILYRLDPQGRITFISESVHHWGYDPDQLVGETFLDCVHPEDLDKARFRLNERRTGKRATRLLEVRLFTPEKTIDVEYSSSPLFLVNSEGVYPEGKPSSQNFLGTQGIARDISERKKVEDDLRMYQFALDKASDSLLMVDDQFNILYANELACSSLGYTREELTGMTALDIDPDFPPEMVKPHIEELKRRGRMVFESRHLSKDGRVFPVEVSSSYFDYKGKFIACAFDRDITERKGAEEVLQERERYLSAIIETAQDGFWVIDKNLRIIEANQTYCRMMGYSIDEMKTLRISDIDASESTSETAERIDKIRREGSDLFETKQRRKDGSVFDIEVSVKLMDENGEQFICFGRDISERKQAEDNLRMYKFALDNASENLLMVDKDFNIYYSNKASSDSLGYSREELQKMSVHDIDPDFTPEMVPSFWEELFKCKKKIFETTHRDKHGRVFPVEVSTSYMEFKGKIVSCAFDRDITERKQFEQSLRESEEKYRSITEQTADIISLTDINGIITYISSAAKKILQYEPEEMIGTHFTQYVAEETIADAGKAFADIVGHRRKTYNYSTVMKRKDGSLVSGELNGSYFESGAMAGVMVNIRDITERKRMEDNLRESEEKYRSIFDNSAVGIFRTSPEGKILSANRFLADYFGFSSSIEMTEYFQDIRHELYARPEDRDDFVNVLETEGVIKNFETIMLKKDGTPRWTSLTARAIKDDSGKTLYYDGIMEDITSRKKAEEERERLREQLGQVQKMESVGRLAGGVAHDFNNMLGVILGHTELALEQIKPGQQIYDDLQEIQNAAERSSSLTRQLLAFARQQAIAPRAMDLNVTVKGLLNMLRRLIGENVELLWKPGKTLWPVKLDPSQIDQILVNLCVNSRQAIPDTGKIVIETKNASLDEAHCARYPDCRPGEYVLMVVSDNGCGMDKDTLNKLFEPFFTTKETGEGTGLGLSTVYGIVKQNNGFINVYSEPGHGTTFSIYLPRYTGKSRHEKTKKTFFARPPGQ